MYKRIGSIVLSVALVLGNVSGLEMEAASDSAEECIEEVNTVIGDVPEEEEQEWTCIDGVIYVPEGITRIEEGELSCIGGEGWFPGAKKIVLPSTLEYIGDDAFEYCELEEIVIPGNVKELGAGTFSWCENLKKVTIEDGVEKIGTFLFRGCSNLETVVMPKAVKDWDTTCAFMWCDNLKNVTLPEEGMDTMGTGMFYGCESLEEIIVPDCVTTMNYGITSGCVSLKLLKAGYNVINFESEGEDIYGALNFTSGCFGTSCKDMVLEAPVDSAIVKYAKNYIYFTVKYKYPDFERMEYVCDKKMVKYQDTEYMYTLEIKRKAYPEETVIYPDRAEGLNPNFVTDRIECQGMQLWHGAIDGIGDSDGRTSEINATYVYIDERRLFPKKGEIQYFLWKYYTQDENLEYTVEHEDYFKITLTEQSLKEKRVQIEILTSGIWDGEDAQWELLTPAIDTGVLTPTPTQIPQVTSTPMQTTEQQMRPTEVPEPTKVFQQDNKKETVVTEKITPTIKVEKPAKVKLKSAKQLTVIKQGKKKYKKEVKLSWKKVKNADGYVVYMKSGKGKYKAVKTINNGKTVRYTRKKLKKSKTYYFKIRAYRKVNGQKVYGNYSGVKKIKIK